MNWWQNYYSFLLELEEQKKRKLVNEICIPRRNKLYLISSKILKLLKFEFCFDMFWWFSWHARHSRNRKYSLLYRGKKHLKPLFLFRYPRAFLIHYKIIFLIIRFVINSYLLSLESNSQPRRRRIFRKTKYSHKNPEPSLSK